MKTFKQFIEIHHHDNPKLGLKHMMYHAFASKDLDVDGDVDALEKSVPDEITGTEKTDQTKKMMQKYKKEKQHTRIGVANEQSYSYALGNYKPIEDLSAAAGGAQLTRQDLDGVEKYADRLYKAVGIDVEFTRHFLDRVNDARNRTQITVAELIRLFRQSFKKYGKKIAQLGPDAEAVLNDMQTDVNMPFALKWDGNELDLVAKTVMRKKDFATSNQKLSFN